MGRINVRVDEDLLDEVDSQGEVRSEVVRDALKQYLGKEEVSDAEAEAELNQVVERVVDRKMEDDIYPRFDNIYDRIDEEMDAEEEKKALEVQTALDREVHRFYENYTRAFEEPLGDIVANLLEEDAREKSEKLRDMNDASWLLEPEEKEANE